MAAYSGLSNTTCLRLTKGSLLCPCFLTASAAHAQANLTFSGGNGTPLTLTLTAPVTYTVTANAAANAPAFFFDGAGNLFMGFSAVTGTLTFSVNGGAPIVIDTANSGFNGGLFTPDDTYVFSSAGPGLTVGDVVVLNAGSVTTTGSVPAAALSGGSFTTFLFDAQANRVSNDGVSSTVAAAPEPASLALLVPALPLVGLARRRKSPVRV